MGNEETEDGLEWSSEAEVEWVKWAWWVSLEDIWKFIPLQKNMKKYDNQKIEKCDFVVGDLVLLYNSRLHLFSGELKSKWTGPFWITQVFSHVSVELENMGV